MDGQPASGRTRIRPLGIDEMQILSTLEREWMWRSESRSQLVIQCQRTEDGVWLSELLVVIYDIQRECVQDDLVKWRSSWIFYDSRADSTSNDFLYFTTDPTMPSLITRHLNKIFNRGIFKRLKIGLPFVPLFLLPSLYLKILAYNHSDFRKGSCLVLLFAVRIK